MEFDFNTSLVKWQKETETTGGVGTITSSPQVLELLDHALSENPFKGLFLPLLPNVSFDAKGNHSHAKQP